MMYSWCTRMQLLSAVTCPQYHYKIWNSQTEICLVNRLDVVGPVYHLFSLNIIISSCPMSERAISFHLLFDGWRKW